ncbi:MAG TPA: alkaline phosphatase family protein [Terriglobales bacterium]|nr:alkaline phosphatase family protein [Terriglobales bacterium]
MDRRNFLRGLLGAAGGAFLSRNSGLLNQQLFAEGREDTGVLGSGKSAIDHIVVVMMENRSFDHLLGWLPNADGKQAGLTYVDSQGVAHQTYDLAPDYTGCPHADPDHSYSGGRIEYDNGQMDGFLRAGKNDIYSIGYYSEQDLPFYNALARNYTSFDRYFCSILSSTFPNRIFQHAAQTDRLSNTETISTLPTIWDRLTQARISARYYYYNIPFLALWGAKYIPISATYPQFLADAATGKLPAVSFIDPRYTTVDTGDGNDDHPHADMRAGERFMADVFNAVSSARTWSSTVLIFTFDEWGGFFDHVAPPRVIALDSVDPDLVNGNALLGFRIPPLVVSPFSRGDAQNPRVMHQVFDHTSILKLIEWRFGLQPLTARDASDQIGNLNSALNLDQPDASIPSLPVPASYVPTPCSQGNVFGDTFGSGESVDMQTLQNLAARYGWPV